MYPSGHLAMSTEQVHSAGFQYAHGCHRKDSVPENPRMNVRMEGLYTNMLHPVTFTESGEGCLSFISLYPLSLLHYQSISFIFLFVEWISWVALGGLLVLELQIWSWLSIIGHRKSLNSQFKDQSTHWFLLRHKHAHCSHLCNKYMSEIRKQDFQEIVD